jgi:hypothetical protein
MLVRPRRKSRTARGSSGWHRGTMFGENFDRPQGQLNLRQRGTVRGIAMTQTQTPSQTIEGGFHWHPSIDDSLNIRPMLINSFVI